MSEHARQRARERCPGFKAARIVDEVREALIEGRVSAHRPGYSRRRKNLLWCWNDDRIYALRLMPSGFMVTTTVSRRVAPTQ